MMLLPSPKRLGERLLARRCPQTLGVESPGGCGGGEGGQGIMHNFTGPKRVKLPPSREGLDAAAGRVDAAAGRADAAAEVAHRPEQHHQIDYQGIMHKAVAPPISWDAADDVLAAPDEVDEDHAPKPSKAAGEPKPSKAAGVATMGGRTGQESPHSPDEPEAEESDEAGDFLIYYIIGGTRRTRRTSARSLRPSRPSPARPPESTRSLRRGGGGPPRRHPCHHLLREWCTLRFRAFAITITATR